MKTPVLYNSTLTMKMFTALFVIMVTFLAFLILGIIVALPIWGNDIITVGEKAIDASNISQINQLKYLQCVFSLGIFILPPFIISWLITGSKYKYLFLNKNVNFYLLLVCCVMIIVLIPVTNFIAVFNVQLELPEFMSGLEMRMRNTELDAKNITDAFLNVNGLSGLFVNLFVMAIIPAVGEELLFRGVIQRLMVELTKNVHWGIVISAILFSAFHFQFFGFLPRMFLGIFLGYMLVLGKNMWFPIFAHFANNAFAVIMHYIYKDKGVLNEVENVGTEGTLYFTLMGIIIFVIMLIHFIKMSGKDVLKEYRFSIVTKQES